MALPPSTPPKRYALAVGASGLGLLGVVGAWRGPEVAAGLDGSIVLLAAAAVLAECAPIRVARSRFDEEATTAPVFALALLILSGTATAVLAQCLAALVAGVRRRKDPLRVAFDVGRYALAFTAAGLLLDGLSAVPRPGTWPFETADLPAIVVAGVAWFLLSTSLQGVAAALEAGTPVLAHLRGDVAVQASTSALMLGMAPIAVIVEAADPLLLPLLALPVLAVHRAGRDALRKEHQALHDILTGLPNRALLHDRTAQALAAARREGTIVAVMLLDLDRFKEVNDTLGHHHGDELLRQVGPRVASALREADTVARLGGDEFAVLAPGLHDLAGATEVGERILDALEPNFQIEGVGLDVGCSIGIATFPEHGEDVDTLLERADVAMYRAKRAQAGYEVYDSDDDDHDPDRLALMNELRRAIEHRELVLAFQPKVDLATGAVHGVEALVRWNHPERGLLLPGAFVGHAEHTGLIRPLTFEVLQEALRACSGWRRSGVELGVAVNLSARSLLDHALPGEVGALLERFSVPPGLLTLEITESTIMADPLRARTILAELAEMGVGLAIDDFGTGYSSLGHLKRLHVHELKIDRSFVVSMRSDEHDATIVRSTIDLGRNLGLRVVAEGIEDDAVRAELAAMGCHLGQGWAIGRPLPAEEIARWASVRGLRAAA